MTTLTLARVLGATALAAFSAASWGCAANALQPATINHSTAALADPGSERAIRSVLHQYETALNANDTDSIVALYGSAPIFMPQHSAALVGRDAVRDGYRHVFDTLKLDIRFQVHEVFVDGEWAWARTSSAGRTTVLAAGTEVTEGNNELFIFRHEGSDWKIHRYLFSTSRPQL